MCCIKKKNWYGIQVVTPSGSTRPPHQHNPELDAARAERKSIGQALDSPKFFIFFYLIFFSSYLRFSPRRRLLPLGTTDGAHCSAQCCSLKYFARTLCRKVNRRKFTSGASSPRALIALVAGHAAAGPAGADRRERHRVKKEKLLRSRGLTAHA